MEVFSYRAAQIGGGDSYRLAQTNKRGGNVTIFVIVLVRSIAFVGDAPASGDMAAGWAALGWPGGGESGGLLSGHLCII